MRIYKLDGTFIETNEDSFGWDLSNIIIDESVPNYEERNRHYRSQEQLKVKQSLTKNLSQSMESSMSDYDINKDYTKPKLPSISKRESFSDSSSDSDEDYEEKKAIIIEHNLPKVHSYVKNTEIGIQGSGIENNFIKLENVDSKIPSKEDLIDLINPCNTESKMLLAVMSFAKFKALKNEESFKSRPICQTRDFRLFLNDQPSDNFENELHKEIENYHATKEDNMMSLMMELVLNDMNCRISDIAESNSNTSDLGNSIPSNSSMNSCSSDDNSLAEACFVKRSSGSSSKGVSSHYLNKSKFLIRPNREEVLSSLGLSDEDKSIQSICEETKDMHYTLQEVKNSFKVSQD